MLSSTQLSTNETVGMGVIEITSIPDVSILTVQTEKPEQVVADYKRDMANLLTEIYQQYRDLNTTTSKNNDLSLELLWATQAVANQTYRAEIKLYLIARTIDADKQSVEKTLNAILRLCHTTLDLLKYEYREVTAEELSAVVAKINDLKITAIVKEKRVENLQNQILPYCYSFDKLPANNQDLSRIVNTLINYPDCAVSFQLIPATYTTQEADELGRMTQLLETLHKGVLEQGVGTVSFALVEKPAATFKYYTQNKNNALFQFNILIYGDDDAASNIATRVYGHLNGAATDAANIWFVPLTAGEVAKDRNFYPQPWAIHELLTADSNSQMYGNLARLPYIITAEEAAEFFRLPFGNEKIAAGLKINHSEKTSKTYAKGIINAGDITVGRLKSSTRSDSIGFSLESLAKHLFVVGTPGSGKTEFSVSLLDRLWHEHHIPFLVIEPAKNEYRSLVESIPELQVFTPGKNFISPFVFNPFVPPKNVKLETYKSTLKTAFAAAVSMSTPLDKIFEESINNCYSDFRWLDTYTIDDKGKIFNITDFIYCFQQTFDEIGYTGDAQNIGRAGMVRLQSLVNLFDNYFSIPIEDMLKRPTLIELSAIENSDQKALIISLLLLSILAYVNANYVGEGGLKNVILLEEAHVLLDADSNAGQGEANPAQIAQGLVKRMLAEIRSYGVGIIIADQSPRKVGIDVVALTDMKVSFRLVEATDKQILADSTSMNETQTQRLAKLKPGEAFLFFNKLDEPEEVVTPLYREKHGIPISLSDEKLKEHSVYWNDAEKQKKLRPYPECECVACCSTTCDYGRRILAREIARRVFAKNFNKNSADSAVVKDVFKQMETLIKRELNDEPYDLCLFACVELHLLRKIKYGTKIRIFDTTFQKTLTNIR